MGPVAPGDASMRSLRRRQLGHRAHPSRRWSADCDSTWPRSKDLDHDRQGAAGRVHGGWSQSGADRL